MKVQFELYFGMARDFFKSNLGSQVLYYSLFYTVLWLLHLLIISLISYFHLILDHNIRTIGDWISDRGWIIIIISKVCVFYLATLFIGLKTKKIYSLKSYLRNSIQIPRLEIIVALLFLLLGVIGIGQVQVNKMMILEFDRILYSIVGTFLFYGIDYAFLIIIDVFYPVRLKEELKRRLFIFPILFYFFSNSTFIYEQTINLKHLIIFFLLLYVGEWRRRNWTMPLLFLIAFIIPLYSFMGLDPVWADLYTPFAAEKKISSLSFFILISFGLGYLEYTLKKKPEYIYRN